ncbi:MAG: 50S ribosomal protein L35 [Planctomycetota bacterium]
MAKTGKFKQNKGALKRFRVTGTGKIRANHAGKGHLLSSKSSKRRRKLRISGVLADCEQRRLRRLLQLPKP